MVKTVDVLDSMNCKTLTTSVEIQMSLIYGKGKTVVPVKIPKVQQQHNSIDCGVFAIAFMVEFCFNGTKQKIYHSIPYLQTNSANYT
jgi:Ulp1 family protease